MNMIYPFSNKELLYLRFISLYASGKRPTELNLLEELIKYKKVDLNIFRNEIENKYSTVISNMSLTNLINQFTNNYFVSSSKVTFKDVCLAKVYNNNLIITDEFDLLLKHNLFLKSINEIIEFGKYRFNRDYGDMYKKEFFNLYKKYTYDDVCRLLDWSSQEVSLNIGGYKYNSETNTLPIFINYEKSDDISDSIKYEDFFESRDTLNWLSKNGRTLQSKDVINIQDSKRNNTKILLFVRKNKDDKNSKEFYFLGYIYPTSFKEVKMKSGNDVVNIIYKLDVPVRQDIYDYITGGDLDETL